jgi:acyl-[acyl-carrier-protein]-phospholipid O-acyltransferase/long-chain-fatty-acid--[acyl-carrier-protein] ligase
MTVAQQLKIEGIVQGVGFRAFVSRSARAHGLRGWVRNRSDGSVEALLIGDEAAVAAVGWPASIDSKRSPRKTTARAISPSARRSDRMASQLRLLLSQRLASLFVAQFLGALNDNLLKNALIIQVAYGQSVSASYVEVIVTIATALFILPYFLFSATAGELADKFAKMQLIRTLKLWEIGVMVLAAASFLLGGGVGLGLAILFLLGIQAAFFGPVKYGILPELLATDELLSGNAVIEAGTFLAILIGTIAGGLLILMQGGPAIVSAALLACAIGGWIASLFIPRTEGRESDLRINLNIAAETWRVLRYANESAEMLWIILGNSWFWFVAVALVSQFPNYAKGVLGADNQVVTLFLTLNSLGIGAGSLLAGRLLKGKISLKLVPVSALAMAVFATDLWLAGGRPIGPNLMNAREFLAEAQNWRVCVDLVGIAIAAGVFIVPLYALMQAKSESRHRSRVVAANNVWNALFMVAAGLGSAVMLKLGAGVTDIFLVVGAANLVVAVGSWRLRARR